MIRDLLAVGMGGAAGSMLRYALSTRLMSGWLAWGFPLGTFSVNIAGSLLIGVVLALTRGGSFLQMMLMVGFCGGFTTFSTFSADVVKLLKVGDWSAAALYILLSVVVCALATLIGLWIGTTITKLTA